jgi:pentatricopeptide repeat protein
MSSVGKASRHWNYLNKCNKRMCYPNSVTFVGVLNVYASILALEDGRCTHELTIQRGWDSDVFVGHSLVNMYAKCGSMEDVWRVFNKMPS